MMTAQKVRDKNNREKKLTRINGRWIEMIDSSKATRSRLTGDVDDIMTALVSKSSQKEVKKMRGGGRTIYRAKGHGIRSNASD